MYIRPEESEQSFRRFEHVIGVICERWEQTSIVFQTTPLKASTYAVRLRDAIRGFLKNHYPSSLVSYDILSKAWEKISVRPTAEYEVTVGIPTTKAEKFLADKAREAELTPLTIPFSKLNPSTLRAVCLLISNQILPSAEVEVDEKLKTELFTLANEYDIAFQQTEPNKYLIV